MELESNFLHLAVPEFEVNQGISKQYMKNVKKSFYGYNKCHTELATLEDWMQFAEYFIEVRRPSLSAKTFTLYRSSLLSYVSNEQFRMKLLSKKAVKKEMLMERSSSLKKKSFPESDLLKTIEEIKLSNSKYKDLLYHLSIVTPVVGLRPIEWFDAKYEIQYLVVKNAKQKKFKTAENALFTHRLIPLDHLSPEVHTSIKKLIEEFEKHNKNEWSELYESLRKVFKYILINIGKYKTYTLYSLRHQFACNLKASKISKPLASYLMGHNSLDRMRRNYGRTVAGSEIFSFSEITEQSIRIQMNRNQYQLPDYFKEQPQL